MFSNISPSCKILLMSLIVVTPLRGAAAFYPPLAGGPTIINDYERQDAPAIHCYAGKGKTELLERLIQSGADVDRQDKEGQTALHWAASSGQKKSLEILIKYKAQVNLADKLGVSPIHFAAMAGHIECIECLIKSGASVDQRTREGNTPLHFAARGGKLESIKSLMKLGAQIGLTNRKGETALVLAKSPECATLLYQSYISRPSLLQAAESTRAGNVPSAVQSASANQESAAVNSPGSKGNAPVREAEECLGHCESKEGLNESDALMDLGKMEGVTTLHIAAMNGDTESIERLIKGRFPVDVSTKDGYTPLHFAALSRKLVSIESLVKLGAQIGLTNRKGETAFELAKSYECARFLMNPVFAMDQRAAEMEQRSAELELYSSRPKITRPENVQSAGTAQLATECIVCYETLEEKRMAALPCGHALFCENCRPTLKECPTCCKSITGWLQIFI